MNNKIKKIGTLLLTKKTKRYVAMMLVAIFAIISCSGNVANAATQKEPTQYVNIEEGVYEFHSILNTSKVIYVAKGSTKNGTNIILYTSKNGNNQRFKVIKGCDGWYKIVAMQSDKVLDVAGGKKGKAVNIQLWEDNGTDAQLWRFYRAASGQYYIKNKLGYYIDISGGKAKESANIHVYSFHSGNAQRWQLKKISNLPRTNLSYALYKNNSAKISCQYNGYNNTPGKHEGIDFVCGLGCSVYSLTDGTITRVSYGYRGRNGLSTIAIYDSSNNKTVVYLHTAPISGLKVGQKIVKGQKIATEDWRGVSSSSGRHTHVEVRNGKKTAAAKSVNDYVLENPNPKPYWEKLNYNVK